MNKELEQQADHIAAIREALEDARIVVGNTRFIDTALKHLESLRTPDPVSVPVAWTEEEIDRMSYVVYPVAEIRGVGGLHDINQQARIHAVEAIRYANTRLRSISDAGEEKAFTDEQYKVLSDRMVEEHRKYGNHLRGGHWAEIAARKVVSHMRDFGCLAAPSTVPLSPEMVEKIMEVVDPCLDWSGGPLACKHRRIDLRTRLLGIR